MFTKDTNSSSEKKKSKTITPTEAHWHTTLTQRGMNSSKTVFLSLFLPLSLCLSHTHAHTHTFMTANWISSVWRQGLLLWRRQVFRRGDGHRKEGRILSTRSFPLWVSLLLPDKRDRWKKRGEETVIESRSLFSDRCSAGVPTGASCLSYVLFLSLSLPLPTPSSPFLFILLYCPLLPSFSSLISPSPVCPHPPHPPFILTLERLNKCNKMPNKWIGQGLCK